VVDVKVAAADGSTDVGAILAGLNWAASRPRGTNIRVVNLSFGVESDIPYLNDPLAQAVEAAWDAGLVVVVSAGNGGPATTSLNSPATSPFVIAVGASDTNRTPVRGDDTVAAFSSRGDGTRNPDMVAPGASVVSLRVPGSHIDQSNPHGSVGPALFRGSGTSQSAAVVSGAAALLLQQRPTLTNDQVKSLLTTTATPLPGGNATLMGSGLIDVAKASAATPPRAQKAKHQKARGRAARNSERFEREAKRGRGSNMVEADVDTVAADPTGSTWTGSTWRGSTWRGSTWTGSTWTGSTWTGSTWTGSTWTGSTWTGSTWTGSTWL
jgi:serine protease AprX